MREAVTRDDDSELGSEMDQIPDSDSESEVEEITPAKAGLTVGVVADTYIAMTGKEPPEEMAYHLTAISRYLGVKIDEEEFRELRVKYGPTHAPESKSASTQTPPQPVPPTRRDAATDPPPMPPTRTYATAATQAAPPKRTYATVATQASALSAPPAPPRPTTNSVSTNTDPQESSPTHCTYKKAANRYTKAEKGKGLEKRKEKTIQNAALPVSQGRAVVLHGAPTKYKAGQMRRWIEEDNKGRAQILGIRWLVGENRRTGKLASSLVIYMKNKIDLNERLRMGRFFRTT